MNPIDLENNSKNISTVFTYLKSLNYAVAIYKLPNSDVIHLIADANIAKINGTPQLEILRGFLMCPFAPSSKDHTFFINPTIFLEFNIFSFEYFEKVLLENQKLDLDYTDQNENFEKNNFVDLIKQAQTKIHESELKKIVLSRTKTIKLPTTFSELHLFKNLSTLYQNSYISLVHTTEHGSWIGATPEVLLQVDKNTIFHTVALAGTKYKNNLLNISHAPWTQKEIEEQALVSRYIINCFKKIRLREYEDDGPKTISQGNLLHLKTDYTIDLKSVNYANLATTLLDLLHPTSAVCGMPKELALPLILNLENHNRSYYAGYLGAINMKYAENAAQTDIFVNLRCMQIIDNEAVLYAGAGITAESVPELEFVETENKFNIILDVLKDM